jgi:hypothetical protein
MESMGTYRCGRDQRGLAMRVVDEVLADAGVGRTLDSVVWYGPYAISR